MLTCAACSNNVLLSRSEVLELAQNDGKTGPHALDDYSREYIVGQVEEEDSKPWVSWLLKYSSLFMVEILNPGNVPRDPVPMCSAWARLLSIPHFARQLCFVLRALRNMLDQNPTKLRFLLRCLSIVEYRGATYWFFRGRWFVGPSAEAEVLGAFETAAGVVSEL